METGIFVVCIALIIITPNWQSDHRKPMPLRTLALNLMLVIIGLRGGIVVLEVLEHRLSLTNNVHVFIVLWALALKISIALVHLPQARAWLARQYHQRVTMFKRSQPLYNPNSAVHTMALVLILGKLSFDAAYFVERGGMAGIATDYEAQPLSLASFMLSLWLNAGLALLGVGLFLRRNWRETWQRLGVRFPRRSDILAGIGLGMLLYFGALVVSIIVWILIPPEEFAARSAAAHALSQSYTTLPTRLAMALSASIGEELLYRGALQPIFGLWLTALYFAAVHLQYTLTPTSVIIFAVGWGFGWLRQRYSTTAAIFAHFTYNFSPFLLIADG